MKRLVLCVIVLMVCAGVASAEPGCRYIVLWNVECYSSGCYGVNQFNQCTGEIQFEATCVSYNPFECCGGQFISAHYESGACNIIEGFVTSYRESYSASVTHLVRIDSVGNCGDSPSR